MQTLHTTTPATTQTATPTEISVTQVVNATPSLDLTNPQDQQLNRQDLVANINAFGDCV